MILHELLSKLDSSNVVKIELENGYIQGTVKALADNLEFFQCLHREVSHIELVYDPCESYCWAQLKPQKSE